MMRLILGNRNYSSWSLRGWLAAKQSGLAFTEVVVPMFGSGPAVAGAGALLAPSAGRVPILWAGDDGQGETVVWDSLAILEYLADRVGRDRFWPKADAARALARAMVAEMHSSFAALRGECPMNTRARYQGFALSAAARGDCDRILTLWAEARARHGAGGPFLFGGFCAADIAFAPIVLRFVTYGVVLPGFAEAYVSALVEHPWMQEWIAAAEAEAWVIDRYEGLAGAGDVASNKGAA